MAKQRYHDPPSYGFVFGKYNNDYVLKPETEDGHIMIVGGVGSGKSTCIAIPTLRSWRASIFAITPQANSRYFYRQENCCQDPSEDADVLALQGQTKVHDGDLTERKFPTVCLRSNIDIKGELSEYAKQYIAILD